jgi:hypothetical protein
VCNDGDNEKADVNPHLFFDNSNPDSTCMKERSLTVAAAAAAIKHLNATLTSSVTPMNYDEWETKS